MSNDIIREYLTEIWNEAALRHYPSIWMNILKKTM